MKKVVDKFMSEVRTSLKRKKVRVAYADDVRDWLAAKGYDPVYGARPLGRVIQEKIKDALSNEVLFGRLRKGGRVIIGLKVDTLTFDYTP